METGPAYILGETDENLRLGTGDEANEIITSLITQAKRNIVVFSPVLDKHIFNTAEIGSALASFAALHPRNRARFVVEDSAALLRDNGRIVEICRQFSTFIQARRAGETHTGLTEMFVVADGLGYLHQRHIERRGFLANFQAPRKGRELTHRFQEIWEQSTPIPGITPLGL